VCADDNSAANPAKRPPAERISHEGRRLPDRDHAQRTRQGGRYRCIIDGSVQKNIRGSGFDRSACDRENVLSKNGQTRFSVNVLRIGPTGEARHDIDLPQKAADDLIGIRFD
jgi:hypothetical protein